MKIAMLLIVMAGVLPWATGVQAQATGATRITGSFGTGAMPAGRYQIAATFSCDIASGSSGPCKGQFIADERDESCTNPIQLTGNLTVAGLDLSVAGSLQLIATFDVVDYDVRTNPDGSCAYLLTPAMSQSIPISGNWNGTVGTFAFAPDTDSRGNPIHITGSFTSFRNAPAPVFPMEVRTSIDAVSATATANIQFRPQDVGTAGSIYAFAVAPANVVKGGLGPKAMRIGFARDGKDDAPTACVLAQISSAGQLTAATSGQLEAFLSGTLSAAGASVTVLDNVSTPAVAGATFYVGYGASSAAMIDDGVYRSAVTVPGGTVCPMLSSQTALWWNPAESGWGVNFNHQGNIVFGTLFVYDASRAPLWLVMPAGAMQSDGVTFSGDLYRTTGPAFNADPFTPIGAGNLTRVGTMTVSFSEVNAGTLRYSVNGVDVNKAIQRQVYGSRAASCMPSTASRDSATHYQDLWWNAAESGWGVNVTHQDNILFATLFTYDTTGRDLWLVMSAGTRQSDGSYLGDLYRASGPAFNASPFTGAGVTTVGTMRFRFSDGNHGTLSYTYDGASVTKSITRQVFSSPVPACH